MKRKGWGSLDPHLSFDEVCRRYRVGSSFVLELVAEGAVEPKGSRQDWRFSPEAGRRVQIARRLHGDLGVNVAGIALALELLEELGELRRRPRSGRFDV